MCPKSTWRQPPRVAVAAVIIVALSVLAGCGVPVVVHRVSGPGAAALNAANQQAPSVCATTHSGSEYSLPVLAATAAAELQRVHITPNPWAAMPPDTVIFACISNPNGDTPQGLFVDSSGTSTVIPASSFSDCPGALAGSGHGVAGCSLRYYGPSHKSSVNPAIAAVLGVIVVAAIWFVRRRRRNQARL